ncbi:hypothetical protein P170DRAFT_477510 [Aspergillus steynii IBT 23096]|uniref:F-box domain-containing protein n=1 Tax=Aspergillus steynii IBT 23096 TaxID=1392250 RepID=A0A2I2G181_9EURO|nr:uncharacterized protein P170DRAFT_477510 [Aspergillus steynii IBT 23096]PLB46634.1 hypothetical protein P170DRAFT_477510 [Aspergillus steynii IBT 23096]
MSPQLEALPYEIQQFILEYLDATHPASLTALACASKNLFATVKPFLFRTIRFSVKDIRDYNRIQPDRISIAVQEYSKLLKHYNSAEYVQNLIIGGDISEYDYRERGLRSQNGDFGPYHWKQSKISHVDRLTLASADGEVCDEPDPVRHMSRADYSKPDACYNDNPAWKPLAEFIKMLPGLKHLVYNYFSQFPPCLLEVLHNNLPGCKLHLYTFSMRSVPLLDDYETKLITSPCLTSIRIVCKVDTRRGTDFELGHPADHAMRHAIVLAPALNRVHIDVCRGGGARRIFLEPRIIPTTVCPSAPKSLDVRNSLHSLRLRFVISANRELVKRWTARIDFSKLKVLGLTGNINADTLDYMGSSYQFPSLRSLFIRYTLHDSAWVSGESLKRFLDRLPPLLSLTVSFSRSGLDVDGIAKHHGAALRRLTINNPHLNEYDLKCLAKYCPHLEYLKLGLKRTWGDANEIALYKALGSIPRLVDLDLSLNAPDRNLRGTDAPDFSDDDRFDKFHRKYCTLRSGFRDEHTEYIKNGYVRDQLMNCALDKDLACAIFRAISAGKPKDIGRE